MIAAEHGTDATVELLGQIGKSGRGVVLEGHGGETHDIGPEGAQQFEEARNRLLAPDHHIDNTHIVIVDLAGNGGHGHAGGSHWRRGTQAMWRGFGSAVLSLNLDLTSILPLGRNRNLSPITLLNCSVACGITPPILLRIKASIRSTVSSAWTSISRGMNSMA